MTSRPTVTIVSADGSPSKVTHPLPAVFKAPIRPDIVQYGELSGYFRESFANGYLGPSTLAWRRTSDSRMP
jgi:hypothetical protein